MNTSEITCMECEIKSSAVSILNRDELCNLEKGCSKTTFTKGELIFKEGTPANYITYVRGGFIKLVKKGIGGKDFILSISKNGAYIGIQNLNKKSKTNYFSAIAATNCAVCFIDIACFRALLKSNGIFALEVITTIFNDEMNYFERLVNNVQQQLPGRVANTLSYFRHEVYNTNPFHLNLTKTELADLMGASRESVSRVLREFQDTGIIRMERKVISILDEHRLNEIKHKG